MLGISLEVTNLEYLETYIQLVKRMMSSSKDAGWQGFLKNKVWELAKSVTAERLTGGTTNDDSIELYTNSHKIQDTEDGFILYNDAMVPAVANGVQNSVDNYPDGMFSIALAFEYGVGIVGEATASENSWEYNKQGYYFGWYLPKSVTGEIGVQTGGYAGFEIYRTIASEVENNLLTWFKEWIEKMESANYD